jgi:hypothetical protein
MATPQTTKTCTKCQRQLPATAEHFNSYARNKTDGLRSLCKECQRADYRAYFVRHYEKVRAKIRERDRAFQPERSRRAKEKRAADPAAARTEDVQRRELAKTAGQRRQQWEEERARRTAEAEEEFRRRQEEKARRKAADPRTAREKQSDYQKHKRKECWEQVRASEKARQKRHVASGKRKEYERVYYEANREHINTRANKWYKKRRETDHRYRLCANMSSGIWQSLKNGKQGRKWETLVGYTAAELIAHLEARFQPGMTWEAYGKFGWHVDHIRPIASFAFSSYEDPAFRECWALANLQPLWWQDNIRKKDKLPG